MTGRTAVGWMLFPFWNPEERRLRALWRIVACLLILALLGFVATRLALPMNGLGLLPTALRTAIVATAILAATWLVDRRRLRHLGLAVDRHWVSDFVFGSVLGVLVIALGVAVLAPLGWVDPDVVAQPDVRAIAAMALILLIASFVEELVFRSWLLRVIAEGLRLPRIGPRGALWIGTAVSSVAFALLHAGTPNVTKLSLVNIAAAGVFLALPFVWTGRLGLPWGLHWTWNLAQGPLFGIPVSGISNMPSLLLTRETGPDVVTGGPFGFEGGITALLLILVATGLMAWWVARRYGVVRPDVTLLEAA